MKAIVVGQRGWVWVGDVQASLDEVVITDAQVVRRWGTKRGLAQLANEGPQRETLLDDPCTVRLHRLAVVCLYECNPAVWVRKAA